MSRIPWAYAPPQDWGERILLSQDEAHHLTAVLRLGPGAQVHVFDGQGRIGLFTIRHSRRSQLEVEAAAACRHQPRPAGAILAPAWTKGGRRGFTVEKAVELGAQGIWLWHAHNSQGTIPKDALQALTRQAVAAAKQCKTPWLPELRAFFRLEDLVAATATGMVLWEKAPWTERISPPDLTLPCVVAVGPEGGLTEAEVSVMIEAGWRVRSLGPRVLRAETAGLYILALVHYHCGIPTSPIPPHGEDS